MKLWIVLRDIIKHIYLEKFKEETYEAIENGISLNPVLNSFQQAVHQYKIDPTLIETFLNSMEMDLEKVDYTCEKYQQYILGSAEVVGLMCLYVFTARKSGSVCGIETLCHEAGSSFSKSEFLKGHEG